MCKYILISGKDLANGIFLSFQYPTPSILARPYIKRPKKALVVMSPGFFSIHCLENYL